MKKLLSLIFILLFLFSEQALSQQTKYQYKSYKYILLDDNTAEILSYEAVNNGDLIIPGELDGYRVTSIGTGAFRKASYMKSVSIPDGVTKIGAFAFDNCKSLVSIHVPDSVQFIGKQAFNNCPKLTDVSIPEGVTSIEQATFSYCTALKKIVIPDSVVSIGSSAFSQCKSLENVNIPSGITYIESGTFSGCSFTEITIPDSVTMVGSRAFEHCHYLTTVHIPESVTSIGESAFKGCENLSVIILPAGDIEIGKDAFKDTAYSLAAQEMIPESFDDYVDYRDTEWKLPADKKVYMESQVLFSLFPENKKTLDGREADYILVKQTRGVSRDDYSGSAYDTITELYLCGRDGTVALLCSIKHSPPLFGRVKIGQSLNGAVATDEELWEKIKDFFS